MTSYFIIILTSQLMLQDYIANLFDLIRLRVCTFRLQIQDLFDSLFCEYVMTSTNTFFKPQMTQQLTQPRKGDVCVRCATQYSP